MIWNSYVFTKGGLMKVIINIKLISYLLIMMLLFANVSVVFADTSLEGEDVTIQSESLPTEKDIIWLDVDNIHIFDSEKSLFRVYKDGKEGLVNKYGKQIVECKYSIYTSTYVNNVT